MAVRRRTRIVAAALVVALLASVVLAIPYRPVIVPGAPAPRGPFARVPATQGLRLHVFNTGINRMSTLLVGEPAPERPAPAFVIEHPERGLVVFDTGLSMDVALHGEAAYPIPMRWLMTSRGDPTRVLDAQMRRAGLRPASVRWVVISHAHDDHTGRIGAFPHATVLSDTASDGHRPIAFTHRALAPFDETFDLFGDASVVLVRAAGHTAHDVMMRVALSGGPALLAGDAIVHLDWLRSDDVQRIPSDSEQAARVRNLVRAMLRDDPTTVLFPGHDLREIPIDRDEIVLHDPAWFRPDGWPRR